MLPMFVFLSTAPVERPPTIMSKVLLVPLACAAPASGSKLAIAIIADVAPSVGTLRLDRIHGSSYLLAAITIAAPLSQCNNAAIGICWKQTIKRKSGLRNFERSRILGS